MGVREHPASHSHHTHASWPLHLSSEIFEILDWTVPSLAFSFVWLDPMPSSKLRTNFHRGGNDESLQLDPRIGGSRTLCDNFDRMGARNGAA